MSETKQKKIKIMLVDDTADFRTLFCHALKSRAIDLVMHQSAGEALDYLRDSEELPAITFADLRLKGMSGEEFVGHVRADESIRSARIILTSGWTGLREIAQSVGADGFLAKPFELARLYALVDEELKKAETNDD